jgi:hypothetical protein
MQKLFLDPNNLPPLVSREHVQFIKASQALTPEQVKKKKKIL